MIDSHTTYVLASDRVAVAVIPELGGRLAELTDLRLGHQWLWRNHQIPLARVGAHALYDQVWQGGFEELFPNDARMNGAGGRSYPDHGELWSIPWKVSGAGTDNLELAVTGPFTGVRVSKTISVSDAGVSIAYRLENPHVRPLPHLFKLHAAVSVDELCELQLSGGRLEQVDRSFGNILGDTLEAVWPGPAHASLAQCRPPTSKAREFVYVSDLPEGWCGVLDRSSGSRLRISYPLDVFPYCWLFITYGGWRGHNVVVLEPCTNYPKDLDVAIARGTSAVLQPSETREFNITIEVGEE